MVWLMAKFTTRVVFSCVLFKALVKTRVPHASEPIAHVGIVHVSLRFSRLCRNIYGTHVLYHKVQVIRKSKKLLFR